MVHRYALADLLAQQGICYDMARESYRTPGFQCAGNVQRGLRTLLAACRERLSYCPWDARFSIGKGKPQLAHGLTTQQHTTHSLSHRKTLLKLIPSNSIFRWPFVALQFAPAAGPCLLQPRRLIDNPLFLKFKLGGGTGVRFSPAQGV